MLQDLKVSLFRVHDSMKYVADKHPRDVTLEVGEKSMLNTEAVSSTLFISWLLEFYKL